MPSVAFDKVRSLLVSFSITVQLVTRLIAMDIVDQNPIVPDANEASRIDFMLHLHHQYRTLQQILLAPPHLPLTDMEQDRMSFPFQRADFIKIHAVNAFNILRFSVRGPNQGKLSGPSLVAGTPRGWSAMVGHVQNVALLHVLK